MESFVLPDWPNTVTVSLPGNITSSQLLGFIPFTEWLSKLRESFTLQENVDHRFHTCPYSLHSIEVHSVDWFGPRFIGFVKLNAVVENERRLRLPGINFLRGSSVAILPILQPKDNIDERYIILCEQPRIALGSLSFTELPSGIMHEGKLRGVGARVIHEDLGIEFLEEETIDMTALISVSGKASEPHLAAAMFLSSTSYEHVKLYVWEREFERQEIEQLKAIINKGASEELLQIKIYNYDDLAIIAGKDSKALAAWTLYEELKRQEKI
jgi:ADP-sugar diphosphatase